MAKYIEFLKQVDDQYKGDMVEIIDEDENSLYYETDYGNRCMIEKSDEHIYFEYVHEDRYHDYISPWNDNEDIIDDMLLGDDG